MLRTLIANPSTNPSATALGIGIVVLGLLLVIFTLLAWAMPADRKRVVARQAPAPDPEAPLPRSRVLLGVLAIGIAAIALASGYATTSQSSFCTDVCHSMAGAGQSWSASVHARVACVRCHEGLPVLSGGQALVLRTRNILAEVGGLKIAGTDAVPASRCLSCHSSVSRGVLVDADGLAMSHREVLAGGMACDDCHGTQGHAKAARTITMSVCARCHDGASASAACKTCHRKDPDGLIHPVDDSFGKVALPEKPTCGGCHSQVACDDCHGLRLPHPAGFRDPVVHARVGRGKSDVCRRCHTDEQCRECHRRIGDDG